MVGGPIAALAIIVLNFGLPLAPSRPDSGPRRNAVAVNFSAVKEMPMMKKHFGLLGLSLSAVALICSGCGGSSAKVAGVVPVTGVVTFQGAPVQGASVTFYPDGPGGRAAAGTTDAQGKYQLTTLNANDGATPGKYKVMVSKMETSGLGATMTQEEQTKYLEQHGSPPPTETKNVLPQQYSDVTATPLTATVADGDKNEFNFDLQGPPGGAAPAAGGAVPTGGHAVPPPGGTPPPP